jgi:hypothetical protein
LTAGCYLDGRWDIDTKVDDRDIRPRYRDSPRRHRCAVEPSHHDHVRLIVHQDLERVADELVALDDEHVDEVAHAKPLRRRPTGDVDGDRHRSRNTPKFTL